MSLHGACHPKILPRLLGNKGLRVPKCRERGSHPLVQAGLQGLISRGLHVGVQDTWGLSPYDPKGSLVVDLEPGIGSTWKLGAHTLRGGCNRKSNQEQDHFASFCLETKFPPTC